MKDVISVDELLKMELGYANDEECPICGHDHEDHEPIGARKKFKKNLHSLLISKLPDKKPTNSAFEERKLSTPESVQNSAYNSAIDDVKAVLDELFGVKK